MPNGLLLDRSLEIAKLALDGLAQRQEAISRNVANIDTPGYKAENVEFEDVIKSASQRASGKALARTNAGHLPAAGLSAVPTATPRIGGSTRADGNNVDIDVELVALSETDIEFQAVSRFVSKKLLLLKTIASGR